MEFYNRQPVISSPCLVNGVVYFGSYDRKLYALDAQTGSEKWSFTTNAIESSPAFGDGTIYVGSHDNNTYAINADTGALEWKVPTGYADCIQASPVYVNGVVYTGDSYNGNVLALDAKTAQPNGITPQAATHHFQTTNFQDHIQFPESTETQL